MNLLKLFIIQFWLGSHFLAGIPAYPGIPEESGLPEKDYLFKIERSRDADVVYYQINLLSNNKLNINTPLDIFWVKHSENNQKEPLTRIQSRFSYGIKYLSKSLHKTIFQFRATDQIDFFIQPMENSTKYGVFTEINDRIMLFEKMYIHFGTDSYLKPAIDKIDLHVSDPETGIKKVDTFIP